MIKPHPQYLCCLQNKLDYYSQFLTVLSLFHFDYRRTALFILFNSKIIIIIRVFVHTHTFPFLWPYQRNPPVCMYSFIYVFIYTYNLCIHPCIHSFMYVCILIAWDLIFDPLAPPRHHFHYKRPVGLFAPRESFGLFNWVLSSIHARMGCHQQTIKGME